MTTETGTSNPAITNASDRAITSGEPVATRCGAPAAAQARRRAFWVWGRWIVLMGLIGLNAWWYWRATRPLADLKTIERWIDQHRYGEAEQALSRRLVYSSHDGDSHALMAKILGQRGDMLACARQLQHIPTWWPTKGKYLLMEATAFKQVDRMRDAEAAWQALVKDDPLHPVDKKFITAAVMDLLELFAVENRWSDAAKLIWSEYDRIDDAHDREALLVMRMRTKVERIMPSVASAKLKKFLAADPADWEARRALAKVEAALNNPDEAKRLLDTCLHERPEDARGWADYLAILNDLGDLDALRQTTARIPAVIAEEPSYLKYRAQLLERDGKWAEAAHLYRRLIQARPWEREALYRLALVEGRLGRSRPARECRERSEAMRIARVELNDAFQKVLDLRRLKTEGPELDAAIRRLARVCGTLGWTRDAEGWARLAPPES
jgi:hypothetical protein